MANLFNNPVYTTATDVKDTTDIAALAALTDAEVDKLITKAQYAIDAYLQCIEGDPFVEGQPFLYPIDVDGTSTIPAEISIATVMVVENLFLLGTPTQAQVIGGAITSEKQGPRAVTYGEQTNSFDGNLIPVNAQTLLDQFAIRSFRPVITLG